MTRSRIFGRYLLSTAFFALMSHAATAATVSGPETNPVNLTGGASLTVTNAGSITTAGVAVVVDNNAVAGSVTNDGTIDGSSAISIDNSSILSDGIVNEGILNGSGAAINIDDASTLTGGITNTGTIESSGGSGLYLNGISILTGGLTNSGTIAGNGGSGIYVTSTSQIVGDILNRQTGVISGSDNGIELISGGEINGDIENYNLIAGDSANGIVLTNGSVMHGTITNRTNATISGGVDGISVTNGSSLYGNIRNEEGGEIIGTTGSGIDITDAGTYFAGDITNDGTISGNIYGVAIRWNSVVGRFINRGIISGATDDGFNFDTGTLTHGIVNEGTLSGGGDGIVIIDSATVNGGIRNTGDITGSGGIGINITNGSDLSGDIYNGSDSLISGSLGGIKIQSGSTFTGDIENNTGATIDGGGEAGIWLMAGGTMNGNIRNNGMITGGRGIHLKDTPSQLTIVNNGQVRGTVTNGLLLNDGFSTTGGFQNNSGASIRGATEGVSIYNGGRFDLAFVNAAGASIIGDTASGFTLYNGGSLVEGLDNGGTITGATHGVEISNGGNMLEALTNSGTITGIANNGINISASANFIGGLVNTASGVINGAQTGFYASSGTMGSIDNSGTISGDDYGMQFFSISLTNDIINRTGATISGDIGFSIDTAGFDANLVNAGSILGGVEFIDVSFNGGVENSGTISGVRGILMDNLSASAYISNNDGGIIRGTGGTAIEWDNTSITQTLSLNGGRIIGDVIDNDMVDNYTVVTTDEDFKAEGDFSVSNLIVNSGRTFDTDTNDVTVLELDNLGTTRIGGTFTVVDNLINNSGNAFEFRINGVNPGEYGQLISNGSVLDITGTTIRAHVGGSLVDNSFLQIVDTATPILGGPGMTPVTIADNSYLWNFELYNGAATGVGGADDSQLYLRTMAVAYAGSSNYSQVLDIIQAATDPDLLQIQANVNGAATEEELNAVLQSTLPQVTSAGVTSIRNVSSSSFDFASSRMDAAGSMSDISATNLEDIETAAGGKGRFAWMQAFGTRASQDAQAGFSGYDFNTIGATFGIDTENVLDNGNILGASFTYGATNVNDMLNADFSMKTYQVNAYGQHVLNSGVFLRGSVGYGFNQTDTERYNVGGVPGLTASGDYGSQQAVVTLSSGRDYQMKKNVLGGAMITPMLLSNYIHYMPDDYTETGAGGANLTVNQSNLDLLELGVGIKSEWAIARENGDMIKPQLRAGIRHDVIGDNLQSNASFAGGGGAFTTAGADPSQTTGNIGVGVTYNTMQDVSFTASYDLERRSDYTGHAALLRMGYKF